MTRIPSQLPPGLTRYRTTSEFTRHNVPAGLLGAHRTKAGVWGVLRVRRGRVRYHVDRDPREVRTVVAGEMTVIEPEVPHHVELVDHDSAFLVEFHRPEAAK